jgi:hypothetical protein
VLPTPQKLLNLVKEWGRYGGFGVIGFSDGCIKMIRILSFKSLMDASLPL